MRVTVVRELQSYVPLAPPSSVTPEPGSAIEMSPLVKER